MSLRETPISFELIGVSLEFAQIKNALHAARTMELYNAISGVTEKRDLFKRIDEANLTIRGKELGAPGAHFYGGRNYGKNAKEVIARTSGGRALCPGVLLRC